MKEAIQLAHKAAEDAENRRRQAALAEAPGSATDCRCDEYRAALERIAVFYRGGERATESMLEMRSIAKRALGSPND